MEDHELTDEEAWELATLYALLPLKPSPKEEALRKCVEERQRAWEAIWADVLGLVVSAG